MSSKNNFSIFAALKDLSSYSLQELKHLAGDTFTVNSILDENILITTFKNHQTTLVIHYNLKEEFIKIFSESWKTPKSYFERKP
jgi:UDP-glucose 4-epimerase